MTYRVEIRPAARRALRSIHPRDQQRIVAALEVLAEEPRPPAAAPMSGRPAWRVRIGDYRVIYEIHDEVLLVVVLTMGHRRDVYR